MKPDMLISVTMVLFQRSSCCCPEVSGCVPNVHHTLKLCRLFVTGVRALRMQQKGNEPHIFQFSAHKSKPSTTSPLVCLVIYSPDNKSLELFSKLHNTLCVTGKTGNQAFVRSRWHQNTPCFICLKQSHLDAFTCPHVGLRRSSEQIGKQHKRSAGEVPAGCHNMLVCRRTSVAQSPCLISLRLPLLFFLSCSHSHFTSITCSFHCLYHLLSSALSVPDTPCQPVGLSVYVSFLPRSHLLLLFFHFKICVSWLCLVETPAMIASFIHNAIIRQVYFCHIHFPHLPSFFCKLPQQ